MKSWNLEKKNDTKIKRQLYVFNVSHSGDSGMNVYMLMPSQVASRMKEQLMKPALDFLTARRY